MGSPSLILLSTSIILILTTEMYAAEQDNVSKTLKSTNEKQPVSLNCDPNCENKGAKISRRKRAKVDPTFYKRLDILNRNFGRNPFTRSFLKYFVRNRAQKRERRQINGNYYYNNAVGYPNAYANTQFYGQRPQVSRVRQNILQASNRQSVQQRRPSSTVRPATRKKPFRPPMVFF